MHRFDRNNFDFFDVKSYGVVLENLELKSKFSRKSSSTYASCDVFFLKSPFHA